MKFSQHTIVEWFLRLSLSAGFLSAVADRFGLWRKEIAVWGNWDNFIVYTKKLNPLVPESLIPILAIVATALEMIFAIALLTTFRTTFFAKCSGFLLLLFAVAMTFAQTIKAPLDYSVYAGAAAAFALSLLISSRQQKEKQNSI